MQDQKLEGRQEHKHAAEHAPTSTVPAREPTPTPADKSRYDYAYYKEVFSGRAMPFAFLDLDLLDQNIRQIVARAKGKQVRLASKSLRSVAVLRRILAADPIFQGIMCYTRLPLCLEIDMSMDIPGLHFGVWRSPIHTAEQARPVIQRIQASSHVWLDSLMGYEAQIAGVGDNFPGHKTKNTIVQRLKRRSVREVAERRAALVDLVKGYGLSLRFVNGGGTGSITTTGTEEVITEITVGSGFYSPALFDNYRDFRYQPAAGYAIEIVRLPRPSIYTCLGGGYIASGSTGPEKLPQPYLPHGARLESREGAGEVQTPIRYDGEIPLTLGDPVFMRHSKAGELCERFTHLLFVSDGRVVDEVTTYRGDGHCFI